MITLPPWPEHAPRANAVLNLRYEDIAQDGRFLLELAAKAIGEVVWRALVSKVPEREILRDGGIVPILTRLIIVGEPGPFAVDAKVDATGTYHIARDGERISVDMWSALHAPHGNTWGPKIADAPSTNALNVFAEHVMTRLFAPPDQRRVRDIPGLEPPDRAFKLPSVSELLELPAGAIALDDELTADSQSFRFGLRHTDSNQHVNSLVYPRLFEEALVRRLGERAQPTAVLASAVDCVYRKPCFAGDLVRWWLRAFRLGDHVGAVGVLVPDGVPLTLTTRPHTTARLLAK